MDSARRPSAAPANWQRQPRRRRAAMACSKCHERKVRCDLAPYGSPCNNCRLDGSECVARSRGAKTSVANSRAPVRNVHASRKAYPPAEEQEDTAARRNTNRAKLTRRGAADNAFSQVIDEPETSARRTSVIDIALKALTNIKSAASSTERQHLSAPYNSVHHSSYQCCSVDDLQRLPQEDIRFLETKGCLHLPSRHLMDQLMREYFRHVHPSLPIISEPAFWHVYTDQEGLGSNTRSLSVFLLQTMLFACCGHVSRFLLQELGFRDVVAARESFYRRAKLIYDLTPELDAETKIQGAVLLTFHSNAEDLQAGRVWLTTAIQTAVSIGAHMYKDLPRDHLSQRTTKKRLWWCLVLRDRSMALALRRPLQIQEHVFDPHTEPLDEADLEGEFESFESCSPELKLVVREVIYIRCQLAVVLTKLIMLVYSPSSMYQVEGVPKMRVDVVVESIEAVEAEMGAWMKNVDAFVQSCGSSSILEDPRLQELSFAHIYYYSGLAALYHYQAYLMTTYPEAWHDNKARSLEKLCHHLLGAIAGINSQAKQLMIRNAETCLPLTIFACLALPLLHSIVDVELASSELRINECENQLFFTLEIFDSCRKRFSEIAGVAEFLVKVTKRAQELPIRESPQSSHRHNSQDYDAIGSDQEISASFLLSEAIPISSPQSLGSRTICTRWGELFLTKPRVYLHLLASLDCAFMRGRFPDVQDIPVALRDFGTPSVASTTQSRISHSPTTQQLSFDLATSEESSRSTISSALLAAPSSHGSDIAIYTPPSALDGNLGPMIAGGAHRFAKGEVASLHDEAQKYNSFTWVMKLTAPQLVVIMIFKKLLSSWRRLSLWIRSTFGDMSSATCMKYDIQLGIVELLMTQQLKLIDVSRALTESAIFELEVVPAFVSRMENMHGGPPF